ncbi:MAG: hypoxanthine phosphoribosyltransferase [Saprospiraceae bacterium]
MSQNTITNIISIDDLRFSQYISESEIQSKVRDIAAEISMTYRDKNPVFLVVMNGAFIFAADLIRQFDFPCELSFVRIKSYHGTQSSGKIDVYMPPGLELSNRHVVIIEDIIDTGTTMAEFIPICEEMGPKSIALSAILIKPEAHKVDIKTDFPGFVIPNKFVVGYGLDYNGQGRNFKDIYQLYGEDN